MTTVFALSPALAEAWDVLILPVTRGLLHRSEQVALQAVHRRIEVPVMQGPHSCVVVMPRGVGRVRITRPIVARHVRQRIASVAMQVVARMTAVPVAIATVPTVPTVPGETITSEPAAAADAGEDEDRRVSE